MLQVTLAATFAAGVLLSPWVVQARPRYRIRPWVREVIPPLLIAGAAGAIYWPLVRGVPPTTVDHNFHLLKLIETRQMLARGSLFGWTDLEFAGLPHNVLYPPGGSLLGALLSYLPGVSVPRAYAWSLLIHEWTVVLAPYAAARLALGRGAATVASALVLLDPGGWWVGGYLSSFNAGLWVQAVSSALVLVCLGLLPRILRRGGPRTTLLAGLLFGAAVVFHPQALMLMGAGLPLLIVAQQSAAPLPWRSVAARAGTVMAIGLVASAWWWVPFVAARGYAHPSSWPAPTNAAVWAGWENGQLLRFPPLWTGAAVVGVLMLFRRRDTFSRFICLAVFALPIFFCLDTLTRFGLRATDWVDQLQLERLYFLIRPLAAMAIAWALVRTARPAYRALASTASSPLQSLLLRVVVACAGALALGLPGASIPGWPEDPVPQAWTPHELDQLNLVLQAARGRVGRSGRLALVDQSTYGHALVGPTALAGLKQEKVGSDATTLFENRFSTDNVYALARIGSAAVLSHGGLSPTLSRLPLLATAGAFELRSLPQLPRAWLDAGPGTVRIEQWTDEEIRLEIEGALPDAHVDLGLAYYDAWRTDDGEHPQPLALEAAGPQPELGSGTRQPLLSSIPARNGTTVLRFHPPRSQWIGLGITVLGGLGIAAAGGQGFRKARSSATLDDAPGHPAKVA